MTTLPIDHNTPEGNVKELRQTNQAAFITMSNQSNYAHEKVLGVIKGSFKK